MYNTIHNESSLDEHYKAYLAQGYWPLFAIVKAEIKLEEFSKNKSININIPGIGECQYTGD